METTLSSLSNNKREVLLFADDKARELRIFCPLCHCLFNDPYITTCGHTFCLKCIKQNSGEVCPVDKITLSPVVRNIAVFDQVGELLIHCRYGCKVKTDNPLEYEIDPQGCPAIIKINDQESHESECDYCPVECPNSTYCSTMIKKELEDHLKICQYMRCPHHRYGCPFQGNGDLLSDHLKECKFEGIKGYLKSLDVTLNTLKKETKEKTITIADLTSQVNELQDRLDKVEKQESVSTLRLEHLEEQYGAIVKEISQTNNSFDVFMSKLTHVEQQLGLNPLEPQHLFKCQGTFVGHKGPVWSVCTEGDLLFSASSDNTIKVWNLSAIYEGPRTLTGHDGIVLTVCAKDYYLYSGASDKTIKVWSVKTLKLETSFNAHDDPVCTLTTSDNRLFSGSMRSIKVWDLSDNNNLLKTLPTQNHWVRALIASGRYLYSGSYQSVKIWNLETLEVAHVLQCRGGSVYSLAITNRHIVCGMYENSIHVWDVQTLSEVATLSGHVGTVYDLTVLPTSRQVRIFSASYDKTIRVWNMDLLTCSQTMSRHEGSVTCLTMCQGRIISGSVDSTIKVWQ